MENKTPFKWAGILVIMVLLFTVGRGLESSVFSMGAKQVPNLTLAQMRETGILLDVRTPKEYADGHLTDAINLPLDTVNERTLAAITVDKNTHFYVYCRSGNRSGQAVDKMQRMGYVNAVNIGGYGSWKAQDS